MSAVGSGLTTQPDLAIGSVAPARRNSTSLFDDGAANLFTDPRAMRAGDVLTVRISINDKATFGNTTDRSLTANESTGYNWDTAIGNASGTIKGQAGANSASSTNGTGSIDRSEKIQLSVAATITRVLPNGNLLISGTQEVRVNFELRVLNIAGIVRPRDIAKDNTISYEKIAEARISYGGKGRISDVQQPNWLQQLIDTYKPI